MRLVVAFFDLSVLSGGPSYTLTVSEELERLSHDVTVFAFEGGVAAELGRRRGLRVALSDEELPDECDVVLAGDRSTSLHLGARYPGVPQVFVAHADEFAFAVPPGLAGVVRVVVVLNDRVARRARALAGNHEVVRLTQPVDVRRFFPLTPLRKQAEKALLLGHYLHGERREMVVEACTSVGLECQQLGYHADRTTAAPELAMAEADIVIGKARVIPEAMACGRAAYVYDWNGGDGWVTPERYPLLEADNFGGQAERTTTGPERLRADLAAYRPEMGLANRDLAVANHAASKHAEKLVAVFERLGARREGPSPDALRELSLMARALWAGESRVHGMQAFANDLGGQLQRAREAAATARAEAVAALESLAVARAELAQARANEAAAAEALTAFYATRRHRFAQALGRPLDRLRELRSLRSGRRPEASAQPLACQLELGTERETTHASAGRAVQATDAARERPETASTKEAPAAAD